MASDEVDHRPNPTVEEEDDDPPMLSSQALEALQEFLGEQNQGSVHREGGGSVEDDGSDELVSLIAEDWRLSQFWYDRETAETVATEVRDLCVATSSSIACVACPTLYAYLKKIDPNISVQLLEYDKRFEQYGSDFTFYDYNHPEELPPALKHAYQVVVADPPYLSKECLEKVAQTIAFLRRPGDSYLLLLTGGTMLHVSCVKLSLCHRWLQGPGKRGTTMPGGQLIVVLLPVFQNSQPQIAGRKV